MHSLATHLRKNTTAGAYLLVALVLTAVILAFLPMEKEISSLWVFLFKLLPFVFATLSIAHLDFVDGVRKKLGLVSVPVTFLGFFCYFVPTLFFYSDEFEVMYQTMLLAVPYVILTLAFSYRMGGGSSGNTIRLSFAMLLLMISGIEDLAFVLLSSLYDPDWLGVPAVWDWASHMTVRVGRPVTAFEAYVFIAAHVALAVFVMFYPFRRLARMVDRTSAT